MIEFLPSASLSLPKRASSDAADTGAPGFSYALASASLETRAGAALKAFGAKESASEVATKPTREATTQGAKESAPDRASSPQAHTHTPPRSAPETAAHPQSAAVTADKAAAPAAALAAAPVQGAVAASPFVAQQTAPAAATARIEATAREAQARSASEAAKPKTPTATRPEQPAASEFARLLARKLESGATAFDLRLAPPELGRVAARLTVGEDGKAQLALIFDRQTAHDLFRRDEAGLREMLLASGFDLGAGDLAFSFEAPSEDPVTPPGMAAPTARAFASPQAPLFLASYSRGVVDLFT